MKKILILMLTLLMLLAFAACAAQPVSPEETPATDAAADPPADAATETEPVSPEPAPEPVSPEPVTILVAAAASLENAFNELIPAFQAEYEWITVEGAYDSSGKLQTQIEEGLDADLFVSAAVKQMNALTDGGLTVTDTVTPLLENKIVLIEPATMSSAITGFEQAADFDGVIAIGDPESVPAGQYAQEVFTSLGIWDQVLAQASLGTNVTEVLNWVSAGSAGLGVVYATDAASQAEGVTVIAEAAPETLAAPIIYPMGILARSEQTEATQLFYAFLRGEQAAEIFTA
jgi:molybdate transport system substrate-binding protein